MIATRYFIKQPQRGGTTPRHTFGNGGPQTPSAMLRPCELRADQFPRFPWGELRALSVPFRRAQVDVTDARCRAPNRTASEVIC
jgi:hypothetical protein